MRKSAIPNAQPLDLSIFELYACPRSRNSFAHIQLYQILLRRLKRQLLNAEGPGRYQNTALREPCLPESATASTDLTVSARMNGAAAIARTSPSD